LSLTLYLHPLASFCHKVLIALYENGTPFTPRIIDLMDPQSARQVLDRWPVGKIPILEDTSRHRVVPETTIILEYLDEHYPGPIRLLPQDAADRLEARLWDRFFDQYVSAQVQKIVTDRIRPTGSTDPHGVASARATLHTAYDMVDDHLAGKEWAIGDAFSLADCAAAPALFYSAIVEPFPEDMRNLRAYFGRLMARSSVKRVLAEARPYFAMFPYKEAIPPRFLAD